MRNQPVEVRRCTSEYRPQALRVLFRDLPQEQQAGLLHAIDAVSADDQSAWNGLFVYSGGDQRTAALWVQHGAGNTATVWPPAAASPGAQELLFAARDYVDRCGIGLAQILTPPSGSTEAGVLASAGFPHLVDLVYLYADAKTDEGARAATGEEILFVPGAGDDQRRLADLLRRTYVDSLDCPALDEVRSMTDIVASYRAQGRYDASRWYVVRRKDADVGVLLLTEHPRTGNWELIYMGVVPEARGRRLGAAIARRALTVAARGGAEGVVLAVDSKNPYAIACYCDVGFRSWDRRAVYGRLAAPAQRT